MSASHTPSNGTHLQVATATQDSTARCWGALTRAIKRQRMQEVSVLQQRSSQGAHLSQPGSLPQ